MLFRGADLVSLAPKALDTLHVLLENRGRVVSKNELLNAVWPDTTVEEIGLTRNISLLRKALGDEGETAGYIETIPKRGYRFVAPVMLDGAAAPLVRSRFRRRTVLGALAVAAAAGVVYWQFYLPSRHLPPAAVSLAVLPFEPVGGAAEQNAWARGFTEVLAAELSKLSRVHVVSPATVQRYRTFRISPALMARVLGLQVIVQGTVQRLDRGLRVTTRAADVHSGKLIWADTFDASTDGQIQVARLIAAQIRSRLRL